VVLQNLRDGKIKLLTLESDSLDQLRIATQQKFEISQPVQFSVKVSVGEAVIENDKDVQDLRDKDTLLVRFDKEMS